MRLAIAASGLFLICVDLTVLYVALPAVTRDLAASNSAHSAANVSPREPMPLHTHKSG